MDWLTNLTVLIILQYIHISNHNIVHLKLTQCFMSIISQGNFLAVQWLGLLAFTAEGSGSVPGQGTKILQAMWHSQKKNYISIKAGKTKII